MGLLNIENHSIIAIIEKNIAIIFGRINLINYLCPIHYQFKTKPMGKPSFWNKAFHLYYDGFRSMTLGRTLWAIILIKLFIMFAILKVFFFPNFLKQHAEEGHEAEFVANEMLNR